MSKIKAVIFDWAGTTVDYGCFAPLEVFVKIFKEKNIEITVSEARAFMGMMKKDHIRELTKLDSVKKQWNTLYSREPNEADVDELYEIFQPKMMSLLEQYAEPVPGILDTVKFLRENGYKIGSSTGYTTEMMEIVTKRAKELGYEPDMVVDSTTARAGRPYPWMCYRNAEALNVYPMSSIVKVGDTIADIKEGVNAGCISVGVIYGSSEMGLTLEDERGMDKAELSKMYNKVKETYINNGAHYTIDRISDLPELLNKLNQN